MTLSEIISSLSKKTVEEKIVFNEILLSNMTIMNRSIWHDPETTDKTKLECLKCSNELAHRIWNLLFQLKQKQDENSENILADNINFYRKQSDEFSKHLSVTIKSTIDKFNYQ